MWVSQTYLGCPDAQAKAFVYYFWEDYKGQRDLPRHVLDRLAELGRAFGSDASVMVPMRGSHHEIRSEIRNQLYDDFWSQIGPSTPGLFVTPVPLGEFDPHAMEWAFFPLGTVWERTAAAEDLPNLLKDVHAKCAEFISSRQSAETSMFKTICDAIELKLTFMGSGINFRPIISRLAKRR